MKQKKRKKIQYFTRSLEESKMIKVVYLIEPIYIGSFALSPGLVELLDGGMYDEYYTFYFKGEFCAVPKKYFIEPLPVLMELF